MSSKIHRPRNHTKIDKGMLHNKRRKKRAFQIEKKPSYVKKDATPVKQEITVEASSLLLLLKYFLEKGLLKLEDIQVLTKEQANKAKLPTFKLTNTLSKEQLRNLWLYQMRHHELFCSICGHEIQEVKGNSDARLTYEHRIPKSKGGKTDGKNGDPAHALCNRLKSNYMPEVWEKIGYAILTANGISIDLDKCSYNYIINQLQQRTH